MRVVIKKFRNFSDKTFFFRSVSGLAEAEGIIRRARAAVNVLFISQSRHQSACNFTETYFRNPLPVRLAFSAIGAAPIIDCNCAIKRVLRRTIRAVYEINFATGRDAYRHTGVDCNPPDSSDNDDELIIVKVGKPRFSSLHEFAREDLSALLDRSDSLVAAYS